MAGSLLKMVKVKTSARQKAVIERINKEDFSLVVYKTRKAYRERGLERPDSFYEEGVRSLKQYYTTAVFDPENLHAVSDDLDRFWHEHIVDTARYELLCKDMQAFMHHDPLDRTTLPKVCSIVQVYQYTQKVLTKIYGAENLSPIFFPVKPEVDILVCRHDLDVDEREKATWKDIFPIDNEIAKIKAQYGNKAKIVALKKELGR